MLHLTYFEKFKKPISLAFAASLLISFNAIASNLQKSDEFVDLGKGTKVRIVEQDATVTETLSKISYIPKKISAGPTDSDLTVVQNPANPGKDGHFVDGPYTADELDSIQTYAIVESVYRMMRGDLEVLKTKFPTTSSITKTVKTWDGRQYGILKISPNAGEDENAYYSREGTDRVLNFFHYTGTDKKEGRTCRSSDVVAHEAGHSMLDIFHPEYFDVDSPHTGGFHEAFGDLIAIFWTLSEFDQCKAVILDTGGDLHQPNFVSELAEQFGQTIGVGSSLRNADDDLTITQVENEVHELSRVFTGAIYDVLVDGFQANYAVSKTMKTPELILFETSQYLRQLFIESVLRLKTKAPTFSDFAYGLFDTANKRKVTPVFELDKIDWSSSILKQFERRKIRVKAGSTKMNFMGEAAVAKKGACGVACGRHAKKK